MSKPPDVILEHDDLLIVNKSAGVLSIPDRYDESKANLSHQLRQRYGEIFAVHRLDRDTSGAIIYARSAHTHATLNSLFENRKVKKTYLAIVDGVPAQSEWIMEAPISRDPEQNGKMKVHRKGKPSLSKAKLVESLGRYSLLELSPVTGRTHQLRVHLSHHGHPLLVDPHYGNRSEFFLSEVKRKKYRIAKGQDERPLLLRTPLHASSIEFRLNQEQFCITAPLPKDMRATLNQLRKLA